MKAVRQAAIAIAVIMLSGLLKVRRHLSVDPAAGMLRRAKQQGRNLFPPLRESLELLAASGQ